MKMSRPKFLKKRVYAFSFDLFLVALISKMVIYTYLNFMSSFFVQMPFIIQSKINQGIPTVHALTLMTTFWAYFFFSYYLAEGRTPGKIIFSLKVQSNDHHEADLSFKESFLRTLGYFLCYMSGVVLFLLPFFNRSSKGLGDWISNSHVLDFEDYLASKEESNIIFLPPPKKAEEEEKKAA